jgi:hypothetical protein
MAIYFTGGGYYAKVDTPYRCINVRHLTKSSWSDDLNPTRDGVSFKWEEWHKLCAAMPEINAYVDLDSIVPCYDSDVPMIHEGYWSEYYTQKQTSA